MDLQPMDNSTFVHMKRLSIVSYVLTISKFLKLFNWILMRVTGPCQAGGEDWSEDRKIEKLHPFFPNLENIEIRDPITSRQSSTRHNALRSWFFVDDKQVRNESKGGGGGGSHLPLF